VKTNPFFRSVVLVTVALFASLSVRADEQKLAEPQESWSVIHMSKTRIGYSRTRLSQERQGDRVVWKTSAETHLTIRRFGQELKMQHRQETVEADDGSLLEIRFEMQNPPASSTSSEGKVVGNDLKIKTKILGVETEKTLAWDEEVKSPAYQDRYLKDHPLEEGKTMKFKAFSPEYNKYFTISLRAKGNAQIRNHAGEKVSARRVDVTQSLTPGVVMTMYLDEKGDAIKSKTSMLGTSMEVFSVSQEEALREVEAGEIDLGLETLVKVAGLDDPHHDRMIRYRMTGEEIDFKDRIPSGNSQQVSDAQTGSVEITVKSIRPDSKGIEPEPAPDAEFTSSSRFLQSDDANVKRHADLAVGDRTDPWKQAVAMEQYVAEKLTSKNFSTAMASAAEVAKSLEGDCTEHACLLAAMARAKGIPSRVVVGLVYAASLEAMGGHMWTEVYIGDRWIPLDATLGLGGIGAGHIKLSDSSFSDDAPTPGASFLSLLDILGRVKLEVLEVQPGN